MHRIAWILVAAALTVTVTAGLQAGWLPLGIPGEWEWGRIKPISIWPGVAAAGFAYAAVVAVCAAALTRTVLRRAAALAGLVTVGFAVQMALQQLGYGLGKWPFVLFSPSSSGYYTAARTEVRSAREFLEDYPAFQARQGPFHLGTHPPGLVLVHYGALKWCECHPEFTRWLLSIQPESVRRGFREVTLGSNLPAPDQASIWLIALVSQLASALTVVPIYVLARRGTGPIAAWSAAALWPLVPAVTILIPKSDVLYPLLAAGVVALALGGQARASRLFCAAAAGLALCVGMFLTLGLVTVVPLIVLTTVIHDWIASPRPLNSIISRLMAGSLGFLGPIPLLLAATGHNLIATWLACFHKHATFYSVIHRSYWPWVGFNLAEFAVALGIPATVAALTGTVWLVRRGLGQPDQAAPTSEPSGEGRLLLSAVSITWWITLILLDLSGKNLGEVARLWMFMMPFALLPAAQAIESSGSQRWLVWLLLSLQVLQTIVFAAGLQGFVDPQSVKIP